MNELILVLDNIRSTYNVGAVLRSAEGFGVKKVILSGCTPRYDDQNLLPHLREKQNHALHKTALGAEKLLEIYTSDDIISDLNRFKSEGFDILGLENNISDPRLISLCSPNLKSVLKDRAVLILGEETHGIDYTIYDIIGYFIEIPMRGKKESFNVSVAAGIALFALTNL
ncbi:TrmH family RNA methyltransferase [Candidatus Saccharibacteria bacterium]|nr:TrmH family RNA methyltransferase [Candidatus Saccharibacteria bacterium]